MTAAFVNGVGWVEIPDSLPGPPLNCGAEWTGPDFITVAALVPHYSVERIAWTLGRTVRAVRMMMDCLQVERPHVDQRGTADKMGRVA